MLKSRLAVIKIPHDLTCENKNTKTKLTDTENRLVVASGEKMGESSQKIPNPHL